MPKIISVGGGKGGIGKSFFSANLGGLLSMVGKKTLIIDLDTGGPNIHTFFNVTDPETGIQDYFDQKKTLEECIIETDTPRLSILNSKNCREDIGNLAYTSRNLLYKNLTSLKYDFIIIDLGAGTSRAMLDFFLLADYPFVIFTPDPLSLENAFRFVHKVFIHKIMQVVPARKLKKHCHGLLRQKTAVMPIEIVNKLKKDNSTYYNKLKDSLDRFFIYLVANKVETETNPALSIEVFYKKFFGENIRYLETISKSKNVEQSIFRRKLYIAEYKKDKNLKKLMNVVKFLL